jgi:hypothetical protein
LFKNKSKIRVIHAFGLGKTLYDVRLAKKGPTNQPYKRKIKREDRQVVVSPTAA